MGWREETLSFLERKLEARIFTASKITRLLSREKGYSEGTTYRLVHDLAREGKLVKLGRGLYRFSRVTDIPLNKSAGAFVTTRPISILDTDKVAKKALENRGIRFVITGPSLLYPLSTTFREG